MGVQRECVRVASGRTVDDAEQLLDGESVHEQHERVAPGVSAVGCTGDAPLDAAVRDETNYDKLEVWTWKNGAWTRVRSYTGTAGPALGDEFPGQFHYLKFVSDSSIVKSGVSVDVQYR